MKNHFTLIFACSLIYCFNTFAQESAPGHPRPNFVIIMCDDAGYRQFPPYGLTPSWFLTPSISRIAAEGARFDNFYCTYSLCNPSRAAFLTGLYPHSNGAYDNVSQFDPNLTTYFEALHSNGYHNVEIGKYTNVIDKQQPEFEKWLALNNGKLDYTNAKWVYGTHRITIDGNVEQVILDSTQKYLSEVDTPFAFYIGHLAPHRPVTALPQYKSIYRNMVVPLPANFFRFPENYPSFTYGGGNKYYTDSAEFAGDQQKVFGTLRGVDDNVAEVFSILEERGLLDNTMLVFTDDNGEMNGEHMLQGKVWPYDPSARLPLLIRYPKWFAPGTVINQFGLNIDFAPTILDAAGIGTKKYHFQGTSMKKLIDGKFKRDKFMYEVIKIVHGDSAIDNDGTTVSPSLRAVRSTSYKYVRYHCDSLTEELFDYANDPLENTNQVLNPGYASILNRQRVVLDSMMIATHDTLSRDTTYIPCYLVTTAFGSKIKATLPFEVLVYPNPAGDKVMIHAITPDPQKANGYITIYNSVGVAILSQLCIQTDITLDVSELPSGIYFIKVDIAGRTQVRPLIKR